MAFGNNIVCLPCLLADRWECPEYTSYFPLIIFSCQNDINILLFFKGFSHNLPLSEMAGLA